MRPGTVQRVLCTSTAIGKGVGKMQEFAGSERSRVSAEVLERLREKLRGVQQTRVPKRVEARHCDPYMVRRLRIRSSTRTYSERTAAVR
ncbi:hypothetical protein PHSY_003404 [Pseudozyma hubeiensis SY62]|uniref:Uncharacterized protein n=1 Tax=Pseudozyma hubeiensis (strain SY62) TaxID=1305764 RepID=R9P3M7_PSEHS|nr:hypothetical protein PHSY_003404 [Pseudozyma hubeiensis SY62]GAC95827.1 hypothetical protein PHSY_003404 [Pseudozyma hubeiensis SY62]